MPENKNKKMSKALYLLMLIPVFMFGVMGAILEFIGGSSPLSGFLWGIGIGAVLCAVLLVGTFGWEWIKKDAEKISKALDKEHDWYADFKTDTEHYVIYTGKVFHITDRSDKKQYDKATEYGISIGIPDYQVDFSPHLKQWER